METPSATRRVTRSQFALASQKSKQEDAVTRSRNSRKTERNALFDITNDSPIGGLATGGLVEKTPSSSVTKNRLRAMQTPGSGEALLRGQVKILLQKVEEEEVGNVNKISAGDRPLSGALMGFLVSPAQLLAPTPANTPRVPNLSAVKEEKVAVAPHEVVEVLQEEEEVGPEERLTRALLFDSPGKSEASDVSSSLTYQGSESNNQDKSPGDDNSSAWSLQVNASIQEEEEEEEEEESELDDSVEEEEDADDCEGEEDEDESFDDLCAGLMNMSVQDEKRMLEFAGKHTRFIYNSDDEIEGEEDVAEDNEKKQLLSPNVLRLKGLPVPEGKHLRFQDEEEE